jgi:hypothetical protein
MRAAVRFGGEAGVVWTFQPEDEIWLIAWRNVVV